MSVSRDSSACHIYIGVSMYVVRYAPVYGVFFTEQIAVKDASG